MFPVRESFVWCLPLKIWKFFPWSGLWTCSCLCPQSVDHLSRTYVTILYSEQGVTWQLLNKTVEYHLAIPCCEMFPTRCFKHRPILDTDPLLNSAVCKLMLIHCLNHSAYFSSLLLLLLLESRLDYLPQICRRLCGPFSPCNSNPFSFRPFKFTTYCTIHCRHFYLLYQCCCRQTTL